jgi:hypothetical protein
VPAVAPVPVDAPLAPVRFGQPRTLHTGRRALAWFGLLLVPVLAGYAFFDKGFAYLHVPGLPLFAGEVLVAVALAATVVGTAYIARALEHSTFAKLLLVFAMWGLISTAPYAGDGFLDAARDAALWYYALLAVPVAAIVLHDAGALGRWAGAYGRALPWLLVYSPFSVFLAKAGANGLPPAVPDSAITFWVHKPGNTAVHVTIALAFIWLVPSVSRRARVMLTVVATLALATIATQSRSGMVAAGAGLVLIWAFSPRRGRLAFTMLATVALALVVGWALDVQIRGEQNRTVSTKQLLQNVQSVTGQEPETSQGNLQTNVEFRGELWSGVVDLVRDERRMLVGLGFGRNVAKELGFEGQIPGELRSPHNSHLNVFARMGLVGAVLWFLLWSTWYRTTLRARSRLRRAGKRFEAGVLEVAMVGVTATLANAYFDPTLESPQVAVWLWTLVGLALALAAISRRGVEDRPVAPPRGTAARRRRG